MASQKIVWVTEVSTSFPEYGVVSWKSWALQSASHHPQSNGQNFLKHSATNLTPFQCVLGFKPPLFPLNPSVTEIPAIDEWFNRSEQVWERAHQFLNRVTETRKEFANRHRGQNPSYKPGDRSTKDLQGLTGCKKLNSCYISPFKITQQINPVTFRLELPPLYKFNPTFHVSLLKPVIPGPLDDASPPVIPL